jgi:hypothetical protein
LAAITGGPAVLNKALPGRFLSIIKAFIIAGLIWELSRRGFVVLALMVVAAIELWPLWQRRQSAELWRAVPALIAGMSTVLIITLLPKALAQLTVALLYGLWRLWQEQTRSSGRATDLARLFALQALAFEALFLMAAVWHVSRPLMLALIWLTVYTSTYQALAEREERTAGVLAAAWALVATEAAWVFLIWLVSYVVPGQYVIVPQPALVLAALGYCFGNIYAAQRQGNLNRARLTEYLLIGLILIWIVIVGTHWQGSI